MGKANPANDENGAFELLCITLNEVEDELTNIPLSPNLWKTDGRMYPPQADNKRKTDNPEVIRYRSRSHNTFIGQNGAIKIVLINNGAILLNKPGSDNRKVDDL